MRERVRLYAWGFRRCHYHSGFTEAVAHPMALAERIARRVRHRHNFGDYLSFWLVKKLSRNPVRLVDESAGRKILAIGSILGKARDGDVIWGSGARDENTTLGFSTARIAAVRGPLTANLLYRQGLITRSDRERLPLFDPAVLVALLPEFSFPRARPTCRVSIVPHWSELGAIRKQLSGVPAGEAPQILSPLWHPIELARKMAQSSRVLTSSLHGVIVCESMGVPVVPYRLPQLREPLFKYEDYFEATGRRLPSLPGSIRAALQGQGTRRSYTPTELKTYLGTSPFPLAPLAGLAEAT